MLSKTIASLLIAHSKFSAGEDIPLGVAISGNGMRAQAGTIGVLKALHESDALKDVSSISSVSGGSWGTTQFMFSQSFHDGVLDSAQNLSSFYTNYQAVATGGMGAAMQACGGTMNCWVPLISGMYEAFDPKFDASTKAKSENRIDYLDADLLVCTTLVTQGLMSDNTTTTLYANGAPVEALELPAYWAIPRSPWSGWSAKPTWNVPAVSLDELKVKSDATGEIADFVLPAPSVGTVGAMSSAASGGSGTPALKEVSLKANQNSMEMWCEQFPCAGPHEAETAICSNADAGDINKCSFPSARFIDGAFTENQALALGIAHMQKKHPGKQIRIIGTNANDCHRDSDPTCLKSVQVSSARSMFANGPYPTDTGEWRPYVIPSPNRTVFAESITDEQMLGQPLGPGKQTYLSGTFTTIDNANFGVVAGTKVELYLININAGALQAMTPEEMTELGNVAEDIKAATAELVSKFTVVDTVVV